MALTSYNFDGADLFAPFFGGYPSNGGTVAHPRGNGESHASFTRGIPLDVIEKKDSFEIKADVPGVKKSDIKLNVDGDVLSLSVQKTESQQDKKEQEGWKFHRSERSSSWVRRSLRLPEHADLAKVSAKYTDGVLHVSVPKSDERARTRNVQIE
jgi:HSP20 family protein